MRPRTLVGWLTAAPLFAAAALAAEPRPFDTGSMAAIRAAQAGKPFVLALWSVHCPPCREDLTLLASEGWTPASWRNNRG